VFHLVPTFNDFHIADRTSAAIDTGVIGPEPVTEDIDGDARDDGAPDLGADEFQ
jgi:hypothetical protein